MHDSFNVRFRVSSFAQDRRNRLEVRNGVQIVRALLSPKTTVEVAPDGRVAGVPGKLADMVDVVSHMLELHRRDGRGAEHPAGTKHPGIKCRSNDGVPLNKRMNLLIGKLAVPGDERPAVIVAGQNRTLE